MTDLTKRIDELCLCDDCKTQINELRLQCLKLEIENIEQQRKLRPIQLLLNIGLTVVAVLLFYAFFR